MSPTQKIAVIGSGIAGITAAYQLARRGHSVTVFDKERYPAMMTSYANGGQLSVCNSQTWNTWSNMAKAMAWLFKKDAPLYISPSMDLDKIQWLYHFFVTTARGQFEKNTAETIRLGLASRWELLEIAATENISFDHVSKGILHIYTNRKSFTSAFDSERIMLANGCEWHIINPQECMRLEPSLSNQPALIGGVYTKSDSTGDIHMFVNSLADVLQRKYNVAFCFDHDANDVNVSDHGVVIKDTAFDRVVVAAGVQSRMLSKKLGDNFPIYPVKGYSITVDLLDDRSRAAAPWVSLLDEDAKIVSSRLGPNRLRVAGTAELSGYNLDIKQERLQPLLLWTRNWFPDIDTRSYRPWAGLRPMMPNMMPIVGPGKHPRVWYHTGHGHLGWTLSAGTSVDLANMMENG